MSNARHLGFYRSDRHEALSHEYPPEQQHPRLTTACTGNCNQGRMCDCVPDLEDNMKTIHATITLPGDGRHPARTYSSEAEAFRTAYYASAIEKPAPSRIASRVFGALLGAAVVATLVVLIVYGKVPA